MGSWLRVWLIFITTACDCRSKRVRGLYHISIQEGEREGEVGEGGGGRGKGEGGGEEER